MKEVGTWPVLSVDQHVLELHIVVQQHQFGLDSVWVVRVVVQTRGEYNYTVGSSCWSLAFLRFPSRF